MSDIEQKSGWGLGVVGGGGDTLTLQHLSSLGKYFQKWIFGLKIAIAWPIFKI